MCCEIGLPRWRSGRELPANVENARDGVSIPGSGRSPEVGNRNPLQYCFLGNSMVRGSWRATSMGLRRIGHE